MIPMDYDEMYFDEPMFDEGFFQEKYEIDLKGENEEIITIRDFKAKVNPVTEEENTVEENTTKETPQE